MARLVVVALAALLLFAPSLAWADGPGSTIAPPLVRARIPILYFHEVGSRASFDDVIATLLRNGYTPINLDVAVDRLTSKIDALPPRPVVLTFDDGLLSQYQTALPVLQKYLVPATFFVIPTYQDGVHRYMTEAMWVDLVAAGMRVESHTFRHIPLTMTRAGTAAAVFGDIRDSGLYVENIIKSGFPDYYVRFFCYPNGSYSTAVANVVRDAGYDAAFTTSGRASQVSTDLFTLGRVKGDGLSGAAILQKIAAAP